MRNALTRLLLRLSTKRPARRAERGMTLLEIMIVLAILALVMALVATKVLPMFDESKEEVGRMSVRKLASEGGTHFARHNPSKGCPDSIEDLAKEIDMRIDPVKKKALDPWGQPYVLFCGPNLPPGARGIAVMSTGPDMKQGTADDIKSWD